MYEKFKSFLVNSNAYYSAILILVGIVSFGLGKHSNREVFSNQDITQPTGIIFTEASAPKLITKTDVTLVIASKSGTKYHLSECSGASQIKESNKISFESIELAESAGYTPAANCPGLQ